MLDIGVGEEVIVGVMTFSMVYTLVHGPEFTAPAGGEGIGGNDVELG